MANKIDTTKPEESTEPTKSNMGVDEDKNKQDDMTVGEFIDLHAPCSNHADAKRDMNFEQLADRLGLTVREVIDVCTELGHKLPQGA